MIYYFTPYNTEKNIGQAYNECMELLKDDDYACFVDGDAMFTTPDFGNRINHILEKFPHIEYATCITNRVACDWQVCPSSDWDNDDLKFHRALGWLAAQANEYDIKDVTNEPHPMSGVMILLKKSTWIDIGPFIDGMLGVDNEYHERARRKGVKLWLLEGIYLYHWYRGGNRKDKRHLL